jgi:HD-like signal output (HDOD) protein/CheY-like chemotaxis protein
MKRILFVDDEPQVLENLRARLRKQRASWDMTFVGSGADALRELVAASYDVIISDLRMPGMDGAQLLLRVREDHPHTVRIVLSGHTEQEVSRRMAHVAHQFVAKPCDGSELQQVIERACGLQALLEHPALREAVGKIGHLPVKPALHTKLVEVLERPMSSVADVARVIEGDVGASSKLLQVVNSAFFGLPSRIADVRGAVSYLGVEMVKALALSVEMRAAHSGVTPIPGFSIDALQEHGLRSARIARRLLDDRVKAQDAFSAAMFQDAGELVLMKRLPDVFASTVEEAKSSGQSMVAIELDAMGVSHAEIGAYLLGIWGLPYGIVEGVAYHHCPQRSGATSMDVVAAVHIASALADEICPTDAKISVGPGVKLDEEFVEKLGLTKKIPEWRELAKRELSSARTQ